MFSSVAENGGDSLTFSTLKHGSRCNVFDPFFAELDCGDDGARLVARLQRPVKSSPVDESSQVKSSQVEWSRVAWFFMPLHQKWLDFS
jgi:hypothetical protein